MKKLALLLISIFMGAFSLYAQSINNVDLTSQREIPLEEQSPIEHGPITRGIIPQPAQAYLLNQVVTVAFFEEMPSATISIVSITGKVVYSELYTNPATINIDLSKEAAGEYYIEIKSEEISLKGTFFF